MKIRLMSSNIWGDYFNNPVEPRASKLENIYFKYLPDILGLQECNNSWWKSSLIPALSKKYELVPFDQKEICNHTPLFYLRDKFELLASGRYLYHVILDPSKGYNYGVFKDRSAGNVFAVFCTHFWWKPELVDTVVRIYNAQDMIRGMKSVEQQFHCSVFFLGDLNCKTDSPAWAELNRYGWKTSFQCTADFSDFSSNHHDPVKDRNGVFHGKTTQEPVTDSIDHIGIPAGIQVLKQYAVTDQNALDASDHSPVFCDISQ